MTAKGLGVQAALTIRSEQTAEHVRGRDGGRRGGAPASPRQRLQRLRGFGAAHEAAVAAGASVRSSRGNAQDFTKATIPVFEPHELLAVVAAST